LRRIDHIALHDLRVLDVIAKFMISPTLET